MRTVAQQLDRVLSLVTALEPQLCALDACFGSVLATDLVARYAVPPFANSAMDGFAVRAADCAADDCAARGTMTLTVVGDAPAGCSYLPRVGAGQAVRIMTGAPVPLGADTVVPVEATDQPLGAAPLPEVVEIREPQRPGRHIRQAGEDVAAGETVLHAGQRWTPSAAAAAAAAGYGKVPLVPRPKVAVLATGAELVPPGAPLGFGQIPDSNSVMLAGLAAHFGGEVILSRCVTDDPEEFRAALDHSLDADLIITSGGVSVGAFEVVRQVTGAEIEFTKVAMQPGKPQASGTLAAPDGRRAAFLGLPGNPVSAFVSAWVFVRPVIARLAGRQIPWPQVAAQAGRDWNSSPGREQYVPVRLVDGQALPVHMLGSGSHLIASLAQADALAVVAASCPAVTAGQAIDARLLD